MTIDIVVRKNWRERWLSLIYFFSNSEVQICSWQKGQFPNWFDYGEVLCQYFDDLGLDSEYEAELVEGFVSEAEYRAIKPFHDALCAFSKDAEKAYLNGKEVLMDMDWWIVIELAWRGWMLLKQVISDPVEQNLMNMLEAKYPKPNRC